MPRPPWFPPTANVPEPLQHKLGGDRARAGLDLRLQACVRLVPWLPAERDRSGLYLWIEPTRPASEWEIARVRGGRVWWTAPNPRAAAAWFAVDAASLGCETASWCPRAEREALLSWWHTLPGELSDLESRLDTLFANQPDPGARYEALTRLFAITPRTETITQNHTNFDTPLWVVARQNARLGRPAIATDIEDCLAEGDGLYAWGLLEMAIADGLFRWGGEVDAVEMGKRIASASDWSNVVKALDMLGPQPDPGEPPSLDHYSVFDRTRAPQLEILAKELLVYGTTAQRGRALDFFDAHPEANRRGALNAALKRELESFEDASGPWGDSPTRRRILDLALERYTSTNLGLTIGLRLELTKPGYGVYVIARFLKLDEAWICRERAGLVGDNPELDRHIPA